MRFVLETIRPELQQYFIERNFDGRPYDRDTRTSIYERAKGIKDEQAYGTERDVDRAGLRVAAALARTRSTRARRAAARARRRPGLHAALRHGAAERLGDELRRALRRRADRAQPRRAQAGGFAHDTGEGGLTEYHLERRRRRSGSSAAATSARARKDGGFDAGEFRDKAAARPRQAASRSSSARAPSRASAACCPGAKVTQGDRRGARRPAGPDVRQPAPPTRCSPRRASSSASSPSMRELAGGKPTGFKLCVGPRHEFLAICKAMVDGGHHAGLHRRRRRRGRDRRGADGVRGPRRHAADRGADDRPQRARRHRPARPHPDRRERQGRDRLGHRQAPRPGRGLHERRARDDDGRRLHPVPALPHRTRARSASPPRTRSAPARSTCPTRPSASAATRTAAVKEAVRIMASHGRSTTRRSCTPHMLMRRVDHAHDRAATPSSTSGSSPASCSPSRRDELGRRLGARRPRLVRGRR